MFQISNPGWFTLLNSMDAASNKSMSTADVRTVEGVGLVTVTLRFGFVTVTCWLDGRLVTNTCWILGAAYAPPTNVPRNIIPTIIISLLFNQSPPSNLQAQSETVSILSLSTTPNTPISSSHSNEVGQFQRSIRYDTVVRS